MESKTKLRACAIRHREPGDRGPVTLRDPLPVDGAVSIEIHLWPDGDETKQAQVFGLYGCELGLRLIAKNGDLCIQPSTANACFMTVGDPRYWPECPGEKDVPDV